MNVNDIVLIEDMNDLAFREFLSLLNEDASIPQDWKNALNGCSVNNYEAVLDSFGDVFLP